MPELPLADLGVLVTRPVHQSEGLQQMLTRMGARVFAYPLLHIAPPLTPNSAQQTLASIEEYDVVVFTSANAVRCAVTMVPGLASKLTSASIACLGVATARALEGLGLRADTVPQSASTSEALLALDEMSDAAMRDKRVCIIKGEGGRDLIVRSLRDRGAQVDLAIVYRREPAGQGLAAVFDDNPGAIDMAIVTSGESLARFYELAGLERAGSVALVLPSDRVLEQAVGFGFSGPFIVPRQVNDSELARAAVSLAIGIHTASENEA